MSGPEEVEFLVRIISDGVREKMLRPKCIARSSWLDDRYHDLATRVLDELTETKNELQEAEWDITEGISQAYARRVFLETCDVVAFGAMLVDKASGRKVA